MAAARESTAKLSDRSVSTIVLSKTLKLSRISPGKHPGSAHAPCKYYAPARVGSGNSWSETVARLRRSKSVEYKEPGLIFTGKVYRLTLAVSSLWLTIIPNNGFSTNVYPCRVERQPQHS